MYEKWYSVSCFTENVYNWLGSFVFQSDDCSVNFPIKQRTRGFKILERSYMWMFYEYLRKNLEVEPRCKIKITRSGALFAFIGILTY